MEGGEDFPHLPPGFRFHPSDEELIVHYLFNKVKLRSLPAEVIAEIELYKYDPWDLPSKILVFSFVIVWQGVVREGRMVLLYAERQKIPERVEAKKLDDWVLCRVRQKGNNSKNMSVDEKEENTLIGGHFPTITHELPSSYMTTMANSDIMSRFKDFQLMASILVGHDLPTMLETCSPKLVQGDNTCQVYENRGEVSFGCFDEAHHGWIILATNLQIVGLLLDLHHTVLPTPMML
ncbi:hypothetical protein L1987_04680 [Smallanthus sonchifolius]|uniref:Uncharacterized protein n=1 Tax=Smallanthus sonchifolius TaxID=185202 RepID=A0ACB9JTF7_9ASTR|nr:hypothetical protein L1987_04680 [Smallanthus sonchifolius]